MDLIKECPQCFTILQVKAALFPAHENETIKIEYECQNCGKGFLLPFHFPSHIPREIRVEIVNSKIQQAKGINHA